MAIGGLFLSALFSSSPVRWSLPIGVFLTLFATFAFADKLLAKDLKERIAGFLTSESSVKPLESLPAITEGLFEWLFGERHFSPKCIRTSILISIFSILSLFLCTLLYKPTLLPEFTDGLFSGYRAFVHNLSLQPKTAKIAEHLSRLGFSGDLAIILGSWVFWSVIPDYLSLLKSRIIIIILKNKTPTVSGLLVTLFSDFVISLLIFFMSAAAFQAALFILLLSPDILTQSINTLAILIAVIVPLVFSVEMMLLVPHGTIFYVVPLANLFWASMIPAIWLWIYILSALGARVIVQNRTRLLTISRWFDLQSVPCSFLGFLAGCAGALVTVAILVFDSVIQAFS
jgi:hypothetical protein